MLLKTEKSVKAEKLRTLFGSGVSVGTWFSVGLGHRLEHLGKERRLFYSFIFRTCAFRMPRKCLFPKLPNLSSF